MSGEQYTVSWDGEEEMFRIQRGVKRIYSSLALGLITLFLVTTVVPVLAEDSRGTVRPDPHEKTVNISVTPSVLLEEGRRFYRAGQFSEAVAVWKQAAFRFEQQGDLVGLAWSLSYLSLAQQALGEWQDAEISINTSLEILQQAGLNTEVRILAQALTTLGNLQQATGQILAALESWEAAEAAYRQARDQQGLLGSQINQATALQVLGLYRRSRQLLTTVQQQLQAQPDSVLKVQGLRSLGITLQQLGSLEASEVVLQESLAIATELNSTPEIAQTLFSLGNVTRDLQQLESAVEYYQRAAEMATHPKLELEARLNLLRLHVEQQDEQSAAVLIPMIEANLTRLPPSRTTVYARVNFAESLMNLPTSEAGNIQLAANVLAGAVQQAQSLGDQRAEAAALTQLGQLYEQTQRPSDALSLTQNALQVSQNLNTPEITARALWQLGRLLKQQGDISGAMEAYRSAVRILQTLRSDLVAVNPDVQFSFTETVEPIYREFVSLLLQPIAQSSSQSQAKLLEAQAVTEALQLAELDNFFREACLEATPVRIDQLDSTAAVIYPIILSDRLEVIVSLPEQPLQHYATQLPQAELESILSQMRQSLNPAFSSQQRLKLYQQAYEWLIRPAEADFERLGIKTLVFVLDAQLKNLPMSALYDGQQYLIEKYRVALSPGLQLLESNTTTYEKKSAITAGLSEARQGFVALPGVEAEIADISAELSAKVILNQGFTTTNLEQAISISQAPILHLATHGQFSSNADDTFVLTWDGRINVREFDALLRSREAGNQVPVELLVLSACQTAQGDRRAALGLAGVAVRSGARSTLASLWAVRDESTAELMAEFYHQLTQPGVTKSQALRQAQISLIQGEYNHPIYWAPFVLVGNWR